MLILRSNILICKVDSFACQFHRLQIHGNFGGSLFPLADDKAQILQFAPVILNLVDIENVVPLLTAQLDLLYHYLALQSYQFLMVVFVAIFLVNEDVLFRNI